MVTSALTTSIDQSSFDHQIEGIHSEACKHLSIPSDHVVRVNIKRNDSMKTKIEEVLVLASKDDSKPVLLIGKGETVGKLVSIIEIVKSKNSDAKQYNKISSVVEEAKSTPKNSEQNDDKNVLIEAAEHTKVRKSVVLYTLLVPEGFDHNEALLVESGWTAQ